MSRGCHYVITRIDTLNKDIVENAFIFHVYRRVFRSGENKLRSIAARVDASVHDQTGLNDEIITSLRFHVSTLWGIASKFLDVFVSGTFANVCSSVEVTQGYFDETHRKVDRRNIFLECSTR